MSDKLKAVLGWVAVGLSAAGGTVALIAGINLESVETQAGAIITVVAALIALVKSFFNRVPS